MCLLFLSRNIEERNGPGQPSTHRARAMPGGYDGAGGKLVHQGGGRPVVAKVLARHWLWKCDPLGHE
jgi:hypothetical protein